MTLRASADRRTVHGMEPLDWGVLREQCADDESLVREVVDLYRREWKGLFADLEAADAAVDLPGCKRTAHRLKGALLSLAAKPSAGLAQDIEHAATAGDAAKVKALVASLEQELTRLAAALG